MTHPAPFSASRHRDAFTLIEIMIVMAIIAILAVIALPSMIQARTLSQRTRLLEQVKTTYDAFVMYEADNGTLPLQQPGSSMVMSTAGVVPPGMAPYMPENNTWTKGTDGTWYWLYWPNALPGMNGFIYLYNPNLTNDDITYLDQRLDDGNPNTGSLINYGGAGLVYGMQ